MILYYFSRRSACSNNVRLIAGLHHFSILHAHTFYFLSFILHKIVFIILHPFYPLYLHFHFLHVSRKNPIAIITNIYRINRLCSCYHHVIFPHKSALYLTLFRRKEITQRQQQLLDLSLISLTHLG